MSSSPQLSTHLDAALRDRAKKVVLLTAFLDILGFGIIIPQLPVYASQFGATAATVGFLASTFSAMNFLFGPFWGRLSDRIGRRPVLLISIFGTTLSHLIFAFAGSMPWLFAARFFAGITGANIGVAQAYLADITPPEERSKNYGLFGAVFGVGFAIGPMIGSVLSSLPGMWGGNFGIGVFTAALSLINWLLGLKWLPETLSPEIRAQNVAGDKTAKSKSTSVSGYTRAFALPGMSRVIGIAFLATFAFATMQGIFSLFIIKSYVRPEVQQYIVSHTPDAVAETQRHLAHGGKPVLPVGEEVAPVAAAGGETKAYSHSMGGDWALSHPAPEGLTWRKIEQTLVQPRAARLSGWIFAVIGLTSLLVQGGLIGPLKKRFGEAPLVLVGVIVMAMGLALVPLPKVFWGELPVGALLAIGSGLAMPVLTAMASQLAPDAERGEIIGVFQSVQSFGRIIGPISGGLVFEYIGGGAPFWMGALIMMGAFALALTLNRTRLAPAPATS